MTVLWTVLLLGSIALPGILGAVLQGWPWYMVASLYACAVELHVLIEIVKACWKRWGVL